MPVNAKIPTPLRANIMARAWELFRKRYNYPRTPFRSIGRACFASALKAAWAEARETVRLVGFGADALRRSIEALSSPAHAVGLSSSYALGPQAAMERYQQKLALTAALNFAIAA
ncbi:hypothetical protein GCM10007887_04420 [Methylobacterium haplocladii]|uniref:Uncharacterized protein n=2 Tax=Methylobacterium haplocladii TaxID=1176176 RepID=A0A512ISF4_9HYPH|nr:hypothetical protein MHA02_30250 [Methylobacterium haplocladii]GJD85552.1 hypothetical protein HPGCJGGD_3441 [Methylobacterium haplocladii]GLS57786.1 hypothetical protein GCM10007887_04420 [Methylobacterium haplocladii]